MAEITAQIKFQIKNGGNLVLFMKLGRMSAKRGTIQWASLANDEIVKS